MANSISSMKVKIRHSEETDLEAILTIHKKAFGRDAESNLVKEILVAGQKDKELSLIAYKESAPDELDVPEVLLGHILLSRVRLTDSKSEKVLALAPLAVLPEAQNSGIGSALVSASINQANELGYAAIIALGDGDYYGRFGFEVSSIFGIYPPFEVARQNFRIKTLATFDKTLKGTVIYPETFNSV
ncbi:GNAT family N-acetyltransferase [bacterium]|nr:GNAT family N-acetyltransferase [bacterium]